MQNVRHLVTLLIILLFGLSLHAQKANHINIGAVGTSNGSFGIGIGFNPCHSVTNHFALEGQLSFVLKKNLSANSSPIRQSLLLGGARLYLVGPDSGTRIFINALIGGVRTSFLNTKYVKLGMSGGFFIQGSNVIAGISIEKSVGAVFKLGRRF